MAAKTVSPINGGDTDPIVGAAQRRVQVRPCTAPGSIPGHVFPSTLEGELADACRQRIRTPLVSASKPDAGFAAVA